MRNMVILLALDEIMERNRIFCKPLALDEDGTVDYMQVLEVAIERGDLRVRRSILNRALIKAEHIQRNVYRDKEKEI